MQRDELQNLLDCGIAFDGGYAGRVEYIGAGWKRDWRVALTQLGVPFDGTLAMDAQPTAITLGNNGIPAFLGTTFDPEIVTTLVAPTKAAKIFGERKKGDWVTFATEFPVIEYTGEVSSYGDYNNNGSTGANVNWVPRQSYHYQTMTTWGERELAKYGLAAINYAAEKDKASALILNKFQNKTYWFGVAGLTNYGALNDPSLPTPITATTKTAGGMTWAVATMNEIYADVLKAFRQLVTQLSGLLDRDAAMTLAMSPALETYLATANSFNPGFTAGDLIRRNFPNLKIETAPEYSTASGEVMQLIADSVDGTETAYVAFTEKMRSHAIVTGHSSWSQKKSGGTWGYINRRPVAMVQMTGMG